MLKSTLTMALMDTQGSPITAFLRIPLTWYSSSTHAYAPHETASSIQRVFAPHHAAPPYARRTFCGYCGTPLTYWADSPHGEGAFISLTVGSLRQRDQEKLEVLGLLPDEEEVELNKEEVQSRQGQQQQQQQQQENYQSTGRHDDEEEIEEIEVVHGEVEEPGTEPNTTTARRTETGDLSTQGTLLQPPPFSIFHRTGNLAGISWFEDMIHGSRLGRTQRARRGMGSTPDDSARVHWEVMEWTDDGSAAGGVGGGSAYGSTFFSSTHSSSSYGYTTSTLSTSTTQFMSSSTSTTWGGSGRIGGSSGGGVGSSSGRRGGNTSGQKRKSPEIEEIE
ncbi:hypothetical protein KEM54_004554 [Ascosphaera aggregata]|nr:hypothetical protein KEM54_004554 [Ascosphaera aggregata]